MIQQVLGGQEQAGPGGYQSCPAAHGHHLDHVVVSLGRQLAQHQETNGLLHQLLQQGDIIEQATPAAPVA